MLCPSMLDETLRSLDCRNGGSIANDQLTEFWEQVGCPSIGSMDDCTSPNLASVSRHFDPTVCVPFGDLLSGSMCLEIQVTLLENNPQYRMHEFVWPSVE